MPVVTRDAEIIARRMLSLRKASSPTQQRGQGDFRGDLRQVSLVDLLQLLGMNARTGVLSISTDSGAGELRLSDGNIVDAAYRKARRHESLGAVAL